MNPPVRQFALWVVASRLPSGLNSGATLTGPGAPLAASVYFDWVGNYDGALLTVASLNLFAAALFLVIPRPRRRSS